MNRFWTHDEIDFLKAHYADNFAEDIALALGRTKAACWNKANQLRLSKSAEFLKVAASYTIAHPNSAATRYKPGHLPANKGKKISNDLRGKISHNWFKSGHIPHNTKHDGTTHKRSDGYWWIRISLNNWKQLHVHVWEKANGPVPKGQIVKFRDGDKDNCDLSNLVLTTRAKHMLENTIHRYPVEVRDTLKIISKFKKLIIQHEK